MMSFYLLDTRRSARARSQSRSRGRNYRDNDERSISSVSSASSSSTSHRQQQQQRRNQRRNSNDQPQPIIIEGILAQKKTFSSTKKYAMLVYPQTTDDIQIVSDRILDLKMSPTTKNMARRNTQRDSMRNVYHSINDPNVVMVYGMVAKVG
jgi:hypothetical protein